MGLGGEARHGGVSSGDDSSELPSKRVLYRVPALVVLSVVALANLPRSPPSWLAAKLGLQQENQPSFIQEKAEEMNMQSFKRIEQGTCFSNGLFPISDPMLCEVASRDLNLSSPSLKAKAELSALRPQGCFWHSAAASGKTGAVEELRFSLNGENHGRGTETSNAGHVHKPLCMSSIDCGYIRQDVEFVGTVVATVENIPTGEICCQKCQADYRCWGWTLDHADMKCNLLDHTTDFSPHDTRNKTGVFSGMPVRDRQVSLLYCVALMQPNSYETALLSMQKSLRVSIFACDEYMVYSNAAVEILPGLTTGVIESDLKCDMGGDAGTALNTGIFIAFWQKVIEDGRFRFNQWTVKVDPDAVFFPDRLRGLVQSIPDGEKGVFLNNCKYGLHGPIEVFSHTALDYYGQRYEECQRKYWFAHDHWGEDMYIDQCMDKVLGIRRDDLFNLICEDHCDCPEYQACNNAAVVFHPFKTEGDYRQCMLSAGVQLPM